MNDNRSDNLHCCEYINMNEEKSTIISDLCICPPFGNCCSNLLKCPPSRDIEINVMVANFQDRFRIPWQGGARRISLDSAVPLLLFPASLYFAAQGFWPTILIFPLVTLFLYYTHRTVRKYRVATKFFYVWTLTSASLMLTVFQFLVVPMLDINTNENIIITVTMVATAACFYFTKKHAIKSHLKYDLEMINVNETDENLVLINETENIQCNTCKRNVPSRTYHCFVCKTCVIQQHIHSYWIDCCIGKHNRKPYMAGLVLGSVLFTFLSNLILTTLCHPFNVFATIMLPDDCSDVYYDIMYGICFVSGLYCSAVGIILFLMFINDIYMVSLGITYHEWQEQCKDFKGDCHWFLSRHAIRNILLNWRAFFNNV
ncbi:hypothetical protein ACI65C_009077 [Semiaphis heraclei]